jgi:hypothetical protein
MPPLQSLHFRRPLSSRFLVWRLLPSETSAVALLPGPIPEVVVDDTKVRNFPHILSHLPKPSSSLSNCAHRERIENAIKE